MIGAGVAVAVLICGGGYVAMAGANSVKDSIGGDGQSPAGAGRGDKKDSTEPQPLTDQRFLLDPAIAKPLTSKGSWAVSSTSEGQSAPERAFVCQAQRFADPAGVRAWVRHLTNPAARDRAVQWVELSNDRANAGKAYETIVNWLSSCNVVQQRLVASYAVTGLGDRALVAVFGQPVGGDRERYRTVTLTGGGPTTMVLEHVTIAETPPRPEGILATAGAALQRICVETKQTCARAPKPKASLLPAGAEPRGFMAAVDLPVISTLKQSWVGVDGATKGSGCEQIDPVKSRAKRSKFRMYVMPNARVPAEFGMDTMVAEFGTAHAAQVYLAGVQRSVKDCAKTHSNAKVKPTGKIDRGGIGGQTWRVQYALGGNKPPLVFRIGIVRASNKAAYVAFPVARGLDVSDDVFADVVTRAGERALYFR